MKFLKNFINFYLFLLKFFRPDIYDYDGAYDKMQERRSRIEQEKETAKVDKKVSLFYLFELDLIFVCLAEIHWQTVELKEEARLGDLATWWTQAG